MVPNSDKYACLCFMFFLHLRILTIGCNYFGTIYPALSLSEIQLFQIPFPGFTGRFSHSYPAQEKLQR